MMWKGPELSYRTALCMQYMYIHKEALTMNPPSQNACLKVGHLHTQRCDGAYPCSSITKFNEISSDHSVLLLFALLFWPCSAGEIQAVYWNWGCAVTPIRHHTNYDYLHVQQVVFSFFKKYVLSISWNSLEWSWKYIITQDTTKGIQV